MILIISSLSSLSSLPLEFWSFFARWVDPQFDDEELQEEAEQQVNTNQWTGESPRVIQEHHRQQVEVEVIQDPIKVVVEQV